MANDPLKPRNLILQAIAARNTKAPKPRGPINQGTTEDRLRELLGLQESPKATNAAPAPRPAPRGGARNNRPARRAARPPEVTSPKPEVAAVTAEVVNNAAIPVEKAVEMMKFTTPEQKAAFEKAYLAAKNAAYASAMNFKDATPEILKNLAKGLPQEFQDILAKEIDAAKDSPKNMAQINARIMGYKAGIKAADELTAAPAVNEAVNVTTAARAIDEFTLGNFPLDSFQAGLSKDIARLGGFLTNDVPTGGAVLITTRPEGAYINDHDKYVRGADGNYRRVGFNGAAVDANDAAVKDGLSPESFAKLLAEKSTGGAELTLSGYHYKDVLERRSVNNLNLNPTSLPADKAEALAMVRNKLNGFPSGSDVNFMTFNTGGAIVTHSYHKTNAGYVPKSTGDKTPAPITADALAQQMMDRVDLSRASFAKTSSAKLFAGAPHKEEQASIFGRYRFKEKGWGSNPIVETDKGFQEHLRKYNIQPGRIAPSDIQLPKVGTDLTSPPVDLVTQTKPQAPVL
jgi:hypothetical protein